MKLASELSENQRNKYLDYFTYAMFGLFVIWAFIFSFKWYGRQSALFLRSFDDLFADFFNPLTYVKERDVYFSEKNGFGYNKEYLPLSFVIFYFFARLDHYDTMTLADCWDSRIGMFSCFLFLFINIAVLFHSLVCLCKKYGLKDKVVYALFCSNIMLFSIERANIIFLSVAFLNYFLCFYDSVEKNKRYFACFSLAFSATLKIFPVIFIVMFLPQKKI